MELVRASGRPIVQVAQELGIYDFTLGNWVRQAQIDDGQRQGLTSDERARLAELEWLRTNGTVAWLAAHGRSGQWGTGPFSAQPAQVQRVHDWAAGGGMWVAETEGLPAGAMVLGDAPPYAPPAPQAELYVVALVTDRRHRPVAWAGARSALVTRSLPAIPPIPPRRCQPPHELRTWSPRP